MTTKGLVSKILSTGSLWRLARPARRMATESSVALKGKASFAVDPATLTPEQKKDLITRNLQVRDRLLRPVCCILYTCVHGSEL